MARFVDLSLSLTKETPIFPGDPTLNIKQIFSVEKDGSSLHTYSFGGHTGTHIDAPAHFIENGKSLSDIPIENFLGEGLLIDARDKKLIDIDVLSNIKVSKGIIIFFRTDYSNNMEKVDYFLSYPVISEKLAKRLVEFGIKMIGIDGPSPDKDPWPVHKILLSNEILIIENLCNLNKLPDKFKVYAFPLKVDTDGVPVRVVAEI